MSPFFPAVMIDHLTKFHQLAQGPHLYLAFHLLEIDPRPFLSREPQEWPNFPNFMRLKRFVSGFKVTNTCAEHAVQLATMYNNRVVKTDVQRSYLYATVEQQRRDRSDLRRSVLQPPNAAMKAELARRDRSELRRASTRTE